MVIGRKWDFTRKAQLSCTPRQFDLWKDLAVEGVGRVGDFLKLFSMISTLVESM